MPIDQISHISDNAFLAAFAKCNAEVARILSEKLLSKAYGQAFHRLRNRADSEDIAQEAFFQIVAYGTRLEGGPHQVSTWLYGSASCSSA